MGSIFDKLLARRRALTPAGEAGAAPDFDALLAQGGRAYEKREFALALQLYEQAVAADPARPEGYYKRANARKDLGQLEEALSDYDRAIERRPDYAYAYCNRGFIQHTLGRPSEALSSYDRAIELDPNDPLAHYNRALLLQDLDRWEDALAGYERAIELNPGFADAQYNRGVNLLYQGDFAAGWLGYEWRWRNAERLGIGAARQYAQPAWRGIEPLAGKRLLVYHEAGLGDTIQFCRYVSLAAARGATVILEVQRPLLELLGSLDGVAQVIASGSSPPPFDYHCPLLSLPLAFQTSVDTIPAPRKYLHSDRDKVAQWRATLGERTQPRIGLVWSGNPNNPLDARRSIALAQWEPLLPAGCQYFALQTQIRPDDAVILDGSDRIFAYESRLEGFDNVAALCECLDVVISVDTSIAHLSAALGLETWLLLAYAPDWRWLRGRTDSPWYPGMRLYQQKTPGDWHEVLTRVATDLQRLQP